MHAEDGLIKTSTIVGVVDAVGTPHNSKYPARLYGKLTSGEKAARTAEYVFSQNSSSGIKGTLTILNKAILAFQKKLSARPELLAGICLAVARLSDSNVEVAQIGDAFAVIENSNGNLTVSPYRTYAHETEVGKLRNKVFNGLARRLYGCKPDKVTEKEKNNIRQSFWEEVVDPWIELRKRNGNNKKSPSGYGLLNGQKEYTDFLWYRKFPVKSIRRILLCTDGMIPQHVLAGGNELKIGRWLLERFNHGGWPAVLKGARLTESHSKTISHTSAPEAMGYSLTLF